jgi:DNA-binding response OmpR family regulator
MKKLILIAEDEPQMVGIIEYLLRDEGYVTAVAYNGEDALKEVKARKPDLVVLDIMLPKMNGFEVCNKIRKFTTIPVIILSVKSEDESVIKGLELGADDYITKPFNHRELVLRINKILKRTEKNRKNDIIRIGDLEISVPDRTVRMKNVPVNLTPIEFNLLHCLAVNQDRILTWESLFNDIWGYKDWEGDREIVKVNISRLRKKIEPDPSNPSYIINAWGVGYKLTYIKK